MERSKLKFTDHIVFFVALFILGFIFALAIKAQITANNEDADNYNAVLIGIIEDMEKENSALETSIDNIMKTAEELQLSGDYGTDSLNELTTKNQELKKEAGMTEISGEGLEIIVNDSSDTKTGDYGQEAYIVHDKNLLYIVNDLRPYSTAIAINGQRVIAMSDIRCVGTVILVNQTRLAPPYHIEIIGTQEELMKALENSTEYKAIMASPLEISVTKKETLTVPAYKGIYDFQYATVIEENVTDNETNEVEE